jgi:hypothetical protein
LGLVFGALIAEDYRLKFVEFFGQLDDLLINGIDLVFYVMIFSVFLFDLIFGRFLLFNLKFKLIDLFVKFLVLLKILSLFAGKILLLFMRLLLDLLLITFELIKLLLVFLLLSTDLINQLINLNQINLTLLVLLQNPLKLPSKIKCHFLLSDQVLMGQSQILGNFLKLQKLSRIN